MQTNQAEDPNPQALLNHASRLLIGGSPLLTLVKRPPHDHCPDPHSLDVEIAPDNKSSLMDWPRSTSALRWGGHWPTIDRR